MSQAFLTSILGMIRDARELEEFQDITCLLQGMFSTSYKNTVVRYDMDLDDYTIRFPTTSRFYPWESTQSIRIQLEDKLNRRKQTMNFGTKALNPGE